MTRPIPSTVSKYKITRFEAEIVKSVGRTGRIAQVAEDRGLAVQTIKNVLSTVYKKLGVPGIAAAIWCLYVEPPTWD